MSENTEYSAAYQEAADMVFAHRRGGIWIENPHPEGTDAYKGWEDGFDDAFSMDD